MSPTTDTSAGTDRAPGVWSTLVGQRHVIDTLARAAGGQGMTHAWLFTGPPGSGRSNAALAFAAALQCPEGGCGTCHACQTVLAGSHPDVSITRAETAVLSLQNVVVNLELVEARVGISRTLGGAAYVFAERIAPGVIAHRFAGRVAFGELDGRVTPRAERLRAAFAGAGVPAEISTDIRRVVWEKYLLICAQAGITAVTGCPSGVVRSVPETYVRSAVAGEVESRMHVIKQEVLSRARLTELIERYNLYPELRSREPMDTVLEQMRHDIDIEPNGPEQLSGRKTMVSFRLSYTGARDDTVAEVTNDLANFYVSRNDGIRTQEATRLTEFLKAWDAIAQEEMAVNPFFKKVYESQKAYAAKVVPAKRFMFPPYSFAANYYFPSPTR